MAVIRRSRRHAPLAAKLSGVACPPRTPEHLVIVVVGDRARIEEQIRAEGLGEIRFLEVSDVFGEPPVSTDMLGETSVSKVD